MRMNIKSQIAIGAIGLIIGVVALALLYYFMNNRIDTSTIEYIQGMMKGPNDFLDLANDINVESEDDIKYRVNDDYDITIYYGDQVIDMNKDCFNSEEYRALLESIGIKVYTHVDTDNKTILYRVTYWGEDAEEVVYIG